MTNSSKQLAAARDMIEQIGRQLDIDASVKLWDGSAVPLGSIINSDFTFTISGPGVIASLLHRPTLDRLIRLYALGHIGFEGGTLIDLGEQLALKRSRGRLKKIKKGRFVQSLAPFFFTKGESVRPSRSFLGDEVGDGPGERADKDFLQFHYDVGNEFYGLFLDREMAYTCGYFTNWDNDIDQAQLNKFEMTCRKLRLRDGERLLDIGCGWGGMICHAAKHFGVSAHGVTLSQEQYDYTRDKIARLGLEGKVTVELKDYRDLDATFDKITSIGMYEHVGLANMPEYFSKVRSLLAKDGLFLNHGITRRARKKKRKYASRPEQRMLLRYIFPGAELDDIGHTVALLEQHGFEVHDVEGWREHYARTTKLWCERLTHNRERAVALAGEETTRIWLVYLAGASIAFARGGIRIYQTLASRSARGAAPLPPTRADLYD